eukprot:1371608-Rhodomonas_salina.1
MPSSRLWHWFLRQQPAPPHTKFDPCPHRARACDPSCFAGVSTVFASPRRNLGSLPTIPVLNVQRCFGLPTPTALCVIRVDSACVPHSDPRVSPGAQQCVIFCRARLCQASTPLIASQRCCMVRHRTVDHPPASVASLNSSIAKRRNDVPTTSRSGGAGFSS